LHYREREREREREGSTRSEGMDLCDIEGQNYTKKVVSQLSRLNAEKERDEAKTNTIIAAGKADAYRLSLFVQSRMRECLKLLHSFILDYNLLIYLYFTC
jgi:hypothetical protein